MILFTKKEMLIQTKSHSHTVVQEFVRKDTFKWTFKYFEITLPHKKVEVQKANQKGIYNA